MKMSEAIAEAWTAVEESGVPESMQQVAFREALRKNLGTAAPAGTGRSAPETKKSKMDDTADSGAIKAENVDEQTVYAAVSEETEVSIERLEQLFHIDGGVIKLLGSHNKYGKTITEQARTVAQVVTVVRRVGMGQSDTPLSLIRDACQAKHCYDSKNFASQHMPNIPGFVVKGEGSGRRLEAKGAGVTAFADIVNSVLGEP